MCQTARAGGCPRGLGNEAELQKVPTAMHGKPHGLSGSESLLMVVDHGPQVKKDNLK